MEMTQPNKLQQAVKELGNLTFSNGFEIPEEISLKEAKSYYLCLGIKSKDTADGFSKIYTGAALYAPMNLWNKMKRQIKQGVFKREFADAYDKIIVLHDPTIKPKKQAPKVKALSPKHKKAVNEMVEEGKDVEEIAATLEVEIERVKAYLK
jgi:DNA-binding NarL/FixJ family response regulator